MRTLVVGTDGSQGSLAATAWATGHAVDTGARVFVAHVSTASPQHAADRRAGEAERDRAESLLAGPWSETLRVLGVPFQSRELEGRNPALALRDLTEDVGADLLVVGSSSRAGLGPRAVGPTTHRLLEDLRTPLVVVPAPAPDRS